MLSSCASVNAAPGGDFQIEIAHGNRPRFESHTGVIHAKIAQDIVNGHALAFER